MARGILEFAAGLVATDDAANNRVVVRTNAAAQAPALLDPANGVVTWTGAVTLNMAGIYNLHGRVQLTGNVTLDIVNAAPAATFYLAVGQDATGNRLLSNVTINGAAGFITTEGGSPNIPVLSTAANAWDRLVGIMLTSTQVDLTLRKGWA